MTRNNLTDKKRYLFILSISVPVLFICLFYFKRVGNWLTYSDDMTGVKPDLIFLFSGGGPHRSNYGFELIDLYPEASFYLSKKDITFFNSNNNKSLPPNVNIKYAIGLNSTIAEINYIRDSISIRKKDASILLVSSPYHMRRIKILATRKGLFKKWKVFLCHVPFEKTPYPKKTFECWYKYKGTREMVMREILGIIFQNFKVSGWI